MTYDNENIFAKILRSEIPCEKIYEDEYISVSYTHLTLPTTPYV